jgi:hypothetical protein
MSVSVITVKPKTLLTAIKKAIDDKKVVTWEYDSDGDFTHSPEQWKNKAWFKSKVLEGRLVFGIAGQAKVNTSTEVYAVYHGRFIEMLLAHFDAEFTTAAVTAMPDSNDSITSGQ